MGFHFCSVQVECPGIHSMGLLFCRCPLLASLLQDVILCRPSVTVLMELTDLLFSLGKYQSIMATLCRGTGKYITTFVLVAISRQWNECSGGICLGTDEFLSSRNIQALSMMF
jgi:hypothetical protein